MPRGVAILEEANEILALVDDLLCEQLAELLNRPQFAIMVYFGTHRKIRFIPRHHHTTEK
jgi:hypothetical protein